MTQQLSICCSYTGSRFCFQHLDGHSQLSNSRGFGALFCSLQASHTSSMHPCRQKTYEVKISLCKERKICLCQNHEACYHYCSISLTWFDLFYVRWRKVGFVGFGFFLIQRSFKNSGERRKMRPITTCPKLIWL